MSLIYFWIIDTVTQVAQAASKLLLETGDNLLLETGDNLLIE